MQKKIYITRKIPETGLKILKENNISFDVGKGDNPPLKKEIIEALKNKSYDGVISFLTDQIDKDVFNSCPSVKVFANFAVGFNNIDIKEAEKRNIQISNTPGTSETAVAEHAIALMLSLTTRLSEGDRFIRKRKFRGWDPNLLIGTDLKNKTIGLIGLGQIGTEVAKILHQGFGSKIYYCDVRKNELVEKKFGAIKKELNDILKESDIISLHIPLIPSTKHLLNKKTLSLMKKDSFIINTSRGGVIDEKSLIESLKKNKIKGAGLDVFEFEPKISKELLKLENVVMTPHIASARSSARDMMSEIACKNIVSFIKTGKIINSVV